MSSPELAAVRELDSRISDGVRIRLLWKADGGQVWVSVVDKRSGTRMRIPVGPEDRALDVFRHPFAYAALHGVAALEGDPARSGGSESSGRESRRRGLRPSKDNPQ